MNPNATYDCGNPKGGYLKIGLWEGSRASGRRHTRSWRKINFSNLDIAVMSKLADIDGMEPEDAAQQWLSDNEDRWSPGWAPPAPEPHPLTVGGGPRGRGRPLPFPVRRPGPLRSDRRPT